MTVEEFATEAAKLNGKTVKIEIAENNVVFTSGNDSVGIPLPDWISNEPKDPL